MSFRVIPANIVDQDIYKEARQQADDKFGPKPNIPKNTWLHRTYKKLGGTYSTPKPRKGTSKTSQWFAEKWVDAKDPSKPCLRKDAKGKRNYKPCYPTKGPKATKDRKARAVGRAKGTLAPTHFADGKKRSRKDNPLKASQRPEINIESVRAMADASTPIGRIEMVLLSSDQDIDQNRVSPIMPRDPEAIESLVQRIGGDGWAQDAMRWHLVDMDQRSKTEPLTLVGYANPAFDIDAMMILLESEMGMGIHPPSVGPILYFLFNPSLMLSLMQGDGLMDRYQAMKQIRHLYENYQAIRHAKELWDSPSPESIWDDVVQRVLTVPTSPLYTFLADITRGTKIKTTLSAAQLEASYEIRNVRIRSAEDGWSRLVAVYIRLTAQLMKEEAISWSDGLTQVAMVEQAVVEQLGIPLTPVFGRMLTGG